MVLFVSDIHLGRSEYSDARRREAELIRFLRSMRGDLEHLYLLGDVFEDFIEYDHLVPKRFVRLQGLLADWADEGVPVTYLVGNHDPWHQDFFEREIGIAVKHQAYIVTHQGVRLYLAHGDGIVSSSAIHTWMRGWLRHPVPVWIYRHLLPGDLGISLARFVNSSFGQRTINHELVRGLRTHARKIVSDMPVDAVVFGHSHQAERHAWPEGTYLNTGYWHESRTFGALKDGSLRLMQWNGQSIHVVEP